MPGAIDEARAAAVYAACVGGGLLVRVLCDKGSRLSLEIQSAASAGFDKAMEGLEEGEHAHGRGKTGAFIAVREKQRKDGTDGLPGAIDEARAAAVFAACVGGGFIGGHIVRELCDKGSKQSAGMQAAAASGYSKGGGKAGAFISVRSYQAKLGTADDEEAFYEARAAAVYAACKANGKEGGLKSAETGRSFALTIERNPALKITNFKKKK